jgi:WD40 repeat protein
MNNGYCNDACFSKNSKNLYTTGSDGKIFVWDLNMRKVINCINDIGSNNSKSIDLSNNDAYLAVGSDQGHANIYDVK